MTPRRLPLLFTTAVLGIAAWAGQALAAGPSPLLSLQAPASAELGGEAAVTATLRAPDGQPLSGARVFLSMPAEFAGVVGNMELDSRVTDAEGTAVFSYAPRQSGAVTLVVRYPGDALYGASEASAQIVVTGGAQLYVAQAGLRVPLLSVVLLAGALGIVFSLYAVTALLVMGIARAGGAPEAPGGGTR